jgi:hypothetical protein
MSKRFRRGLLVVVIAGALAIGLSLLWAIPYVLALIALSAWAFFGHLITADDDVPGGWSNPDGSLRVPWAQLALKGAVLVSLCVAALTSPYMRSLGGSP